jgi:uncharacterized membrane protein YheB (UPF0754 family)
VGAILNEEFEQKVFNYIEALETVNEELVKELKKCIQILTRFKQIVDKPQEWQKMLDMFHEKVEVAEKTIEGNTLH